MALPQYGQAGGGATQRPLMQKRPAAGGLGAQMTGSLGSAGMMISDEDEKEDKQPVADLDDFGMAVSEAFPDNDWTPERLDAMKEAIRICFEQDKAGGYGGEPDSGGGEGLDLIFGAAPSKKS